MPLDPRRFASSLAMQYQVTECHAQPVAFCFPTAQRRNALRDVVNAQQAFSESLRQCSQQRQNAQ